MSALAAILKDKKILVVDDGEPTRVLLKELLSKLGALNTVEAENGNDAFRLLSAEKFDLVLCDWNMPEMSGLDLLKKMREAETQRKIPFLMITGDPTSERVSEALEAGAWNFLAKPLDIKDLTSKLNFIFKYRRIRPKAPPTEE